MSTRATIIRKVDEVTYHAVYLHHDGYPDGVHGALTKLKEAYNTDEKVEELLNYGDMSSLERTIEECIFYYRDRQEPLKDVEMCEFMDIEGEQLTIEDIKSWYDGEYTYLFKDGEWSQV